MEKLLAQPSIASSHLAVKENLQKFTRGNANASSTFPLRRKVSLIASSMIKIELFRTCLSLFARYHDYNFRGALKFISSRIPTADRIG